MQRQKEAYRRFMAWLRWLIFFGLPFCGRSIGKATNSGLLLTWSSMNAQIEAKAFDKGHSNCPIFEEGR
jgi:hypothetical protein